MENELNYESSLNRVTVPVIVDSHAREKSALSITRCVYFCITADDPGTQWTLRNPRLDVPFLMLGLHGVILRPDQSEPEFTSPDLLNRLIKDIEQDDRFAVETGYLWLPTDMLDRARTSTRCGRTETSSEAERGDVFRVDGKLFFDAWQAAFGSGNFDLAMRELAEMDLRGSGDGRPLVRFSPRETLAFRDWSEMQVLNCENFHR